MKDYQLTLMCKTIIKALHPGANVDRLYVSRKVRGRGLASIEVSVDASSQRLEDYREKRRGRLITTNRNNTDEITTSGPEITRKQNGEKNNCMNDLND